MAQKRKIHVIDKSGEFFVEPPIIELTGNEQVRLFNHTGEDLIWVVSNALGFNGGAFTETVASKTQSGVKTASNTAGLTAVFEHQIFMLKSGKKAKGNSDPVIIVEN